MQRLLQMVPVSSIHGNPLQQDNLLGTTALRIPWCLVNWLVSGSTGSGMRMGGNRRSGGRYRGTVRTCNRT